MPKLNSRYNAKILHGLKAINNKVTTYTDEARTGFQVQVTPKGSKTFYYTYQLNGKRRKVNLGKLGSVSVSDAHKLYEDYKMQGVDKNIDIAFEHKFEEYKKDGSKTLNELYPTWLNSLPESRHDAVRRNFRNDILPILGEQAVNSVKDHHVLFCIDKVLARGVTVQANRVFSDFKSFYLWLGRQGYLTGVQNPFYTLERPIKDEPIRQRTLTESELIDVFSHWTFTTNISELTMLAIKFLAYTGIRKGELLQMKWSDISFKEKTYQIPKSKNKEIHIVFLPQQAIYILETIKSKNLGNDFKPFPLGRNTIDQACKRISTRHQGIEKFVPHDLRRTWRTLSSKVGIDPHVAERCIGHSQKKIHKTYDTWAYMDERREAMDKVANHIDSYIYLGEETA
jgi:integrase